MPLPRRPPRPLQSDETGVASTVGTVMALLVFLTFLSLIVNQYVPVWMKDSEAAHMSGSFGQFGHLKSAIDFQILAATAAAQSGTQYVPVTTFAPITLGVDGVPIFAGPTTGDLTLFPDAAPWTVQFSYSINGVDTIATERSAGKIFLDVHNRYFVPQQLTYESGAVIRSQVLGQAVRAEPSFAVTKTNLVTVGFTLVSLFGTGGATGTTTDGVTARLIGVDRQEYSAIRSSMWINHTSDFGPAWYEFFNETFSKAFGVTPEKFSPCPAPYCFTSAYVESHPALLRVATPYYDVRTTWSPSNRTYSLFVDVKNDWQNLSPLTLSIGAIVVQHAYVDAAVGAGVRDIGA